MNAQNTWVQALLDPMRAMPQGVSTWNHSDPAKRLAVHRNNVMVSLVDALSQTFPVTQQLVGDTFFCAMAQVFVRTCPPRSRILARYGQDFPGFIAQFPPAATLPYLADMARLEWQRVQALHAADAPPFDLDAITTLVQDPDALPHLVWQFAPDVHLLQSPHAVVSLWAAHQPEGGVAIEAVDLTQPESALIFRSGLDVMVLQADPGLAALVAALMHNSVFGDAIDQGVCAALDFDLPRALALLMGHELLVGAQRRH